MACGGPPPLSAAATTTAGSAGKKKARSPSRQQGCRLRRVPQMGRAAARASALARAVDDSSVMRPLVYRIAASLHLDHSEMIASATTTIQTTGLQM